MKLLAVLRKNLHLPMTLRVLRSFVLFLIPLMVLSLVRFLCLQLQNSYLSWMSVKLLALMGYLLGILKK